MAMKGCAHLSSTEDQSLLWRWYTGLLFYFLFDTGDLLRGRRLDFTHSKRRMDVAHLIIWIDIQLDLMRQPSQRAI